MGINKISIITPVMAVHQILAEMTYNLVENVRKTTVGDYEHIMVMHGRERNGEVEIPERHKNMAFILGGLHDVKTVQYNGNLSIAAALNLGVSKSSGNILCFVHNDVELPNDWNLPLLYTTSLGFISFPKVEESHSEERGIRKMFSDQVPSCCWMISRMHWDKLGGMDEEYIDIHWEDTDFFMRAKNNKIPFARSDVTVKHYRGATRAITPDQGTLYFEGNKDRYKRKHNLTLRQKSDLPRLDPEVTHVG